MRTIIPYNETQFVFVTNHWDIHLKGYCMYEGKLAMFESHDETDYDKMRDNCPYCSDRSANDDDCICDSYVDLICFITPLTPWQRICARLHRMWFELCVGTGWSFNDGKKREWKYRPLRLRFFYYFIKKPTMLGFKQVLTGKIVKVNS